MAEFQRYYMDPDAGRLPLIRKQCDFMPRSSECWPPEVHGNVDHMRPGWTAEWYPNIGKTQYKFKSMSLRNWPGSSEIETQAEGPGAYIRGWVPAAPEQGGPYNSVTCIRDPGVGGRSIWFDFTPLVPDGELPDMRLAWTRVGQGEEYTQAVFSRGSPVPFRGVSPPRQPKRPRVDACAIDWTPEYEAAFIKFQHDWHERERRERQQRQAEDRQDKDKDM